MAHQEFADIYERYRRALFALALSITRCPARAEDAVHDAFARLCRSRASRPGGDRVAYVFAAVRNAAIDQLRRAPSIGGVAGFLFDPNGLQTLQSLPYVGTSYLKTAAGAQTQPASGK